MPPQAIQTNANRKGNALWDGITRNTDWSTGPLARLFARSLTLLFCGTVNDCMAVSSVFFSVLDHSGMWLGLSGISPRKIPNSSFLSLSLPSFPQKFNSTLRKFNMAFVHAAQLTTWDTRSFDTTVRISVGGPPVTEKFKFWRMLFPSYKALIWRQFSDKFATMQLMYKILVLFN